MEGHHKCAGSSAFFHTESVSTPMTSTHASLKAAAFVSQTYHNDNQGKAPKSPFQADDRENRNPNVQHVDFSHKNVVSTKPSPLSVLSQSVASLVSPFENNPSSGLTAVGSYSSENASRTPLYSNGAFTTQGEQAGGGGLVSNGGTGGGEKIFTPMYSPTRKKVFDLNDKINKILQKEGHAARTGHAASVEKGCMKRIVIGDKVISPPRKQSQMYHDMVKNARIRNHSASAPTLALLPRREITG